MNKKKQVTETLGDKLLQSVKEMKAGKAARVNYVAKEGQRAAGKAT
ncbi:hypothetical protein [Oceanospirillum linum]|nr:hypothetical protein [Oceanospirillum linum]SEG43732.1 hypothetical protein SAMN04489856_1112 [Oleiphilus messinensis]SMP34213.1 hypothetical protein SAMN06264348_1111 [Oceanospirillum linum]